MPTYPFPTPIPVIANGYYCRVFGHSGSSVISNDFAFLRNPGSLAASAHDVAHLVGDSFASHIAPVLCDTYIGDFCGCYDLSVSASPQVEVPFTVTGGVTSDQLPISVAALYKHIVGVRHKTGHTYIAPFPRTNTTTDNNNIGSSSMATYQAAMDSFVTAVETNDATWGTQGATFCVLSKITAKAWDPRLIPVLASPIRNKLSNQRRRNNE